MLVTNVDRPRMPLYSVLLGYLAFVISIRYTPFCPIYSYLTYFSLVNGRNADEGFYEH